APVPKPTKPAYEKRFKAIQEFVRSGGHLVICQPPQRDATATFGDMLPVSIIQIASRNDAEPLRSWAIGKFDTGRLERRAVWDALRGPFQVARAAAKPGTFVAATMSWDEAGKDTSPYIVRGGYGMGGVTWVAQDLSDPTLT